MGLTRDAPENKEYNMNVEGLKAALARESAKLQRQEAAKAATEAMIALLESQIAEASKKK